MTDPPTGTWTVVRIHRAGGPSVDVPTVDGPAEQWVHLSFSDEFVGGSDGCNSFDSPATWDGHGFALAGAAATLLARVDPSPLDTAIEDAFDVVFSAERLVVDERTARRMTVSAGSIRLELRQQDG